MAKGNLFLGMGRGSVGDVTFYRADGQQLSRARNRKPRNPKSNAQIIQRAISATIVQAYKAGSIIFDHSFEGKSVPAGSQRQFLSVNMRKLREQVLPALDSQPGTNSVSVVSPRAVFPVPNTYRISEGSLIQNLFEITTANDEFGAILVAPNAGETVAQYLSRLNIQAGDIFTVCTFGAQSNGRTSLSSPQCTFGFMRFTVKEEALSSQAVAREAKYVDIFTVDSSGAVIDPVRGITSVIKIEDIDIATSETGAIGVIRSNENSGLRSTCDMVLTEETDWGIAPSNLIPAWSQDSGTVDSELILEGGDI